MRMLFAAVAITTIATALHAGERPLPLPVFGVHDATALIVKRSEYVPCQPERVREPGITFRTFRACTDEETAERRRRALGKLGLAPDPDVNPD